MKLNRILVISLIVVLAVSLAACGGNDSVIPVAAANTNEATVTINGQRVTFPDQGPVIVDGRTLVPVRGVFEALGFDVDWDADTWTATLSRPGHVVVITIGNATFTTNGVSHTLDVPAQLINRRTMLPIRFLLESVGYSVDWNAATWTVAINTGGAAPTPLVMGENFERVVRFGEMTVNNEMLIQQFYLWRNAYDWDGSIATTFLTVYESTPSQTIPLSTNVEVFRLDWNIPIAYVPITIDALLRDDYFGDRLFRIVVENGEIVSIHEQYQE